MKASNQGYRREVDGIRAIAVVAVILNHFNPKILPSGFLGVDVFFVISGFVITMSLSHGPRRSMKVYLQEFYFRRIKRLMPALVACVLVSGVFASMLTTEPGPSFKTGIFSLFGMSNLFLLHDSVDYFARSTSINVFTHTWSLGVEEQFYLFFPVFLCFCGFHSEWGRNPRMKAAVTLSGLCVLSFIAFLLLSSTNPAAAFYLMPVRFWELGVGCLAFLLSVNAPRFERWVGVSRSFASAITLLSIIGLLLLPEGLKTWSTSAIVVFTASLILLVHRDHVTSRVLSSWLPIHIGLLSYSLYLWHWPVSAIFRNLIGFSGSPMIVVLQCMIIVVAAECSFRFVERPLRQMKWSDRQWVSIAYGVSACAASALILLTFAVPLNRKLRVIPSRTQELSVVMDLKCFLPTSSNPIDACLRPTQREKKHVFLMGDSHAANLVAALEADALKSGFELRYLADRALANHLLGGKDCGRTACEDDEAGARVRFLSTYMRPHDVFVFSMARDRLYASDESLHFPEVKLRRDLNSGAQVFERNLARLVATVAHLGGRTVLVDDIPKVCTSAEYDIWQNGLVGLCELSRKQSLLHREPLSVVYRDLMSRYPNTFVLDPYSVLCPSRECSNYLSGNVIYADGSPHLTAFAARLLSAPLAGYL